LFLNRREVLYVEENGGEIMETTAKLIYEDLRNFLAQTIKTA